MAKHTWVELAQTRIWKEANQVRMGPVTEVAEQQLPLIEDCYRKHGWSEQGTRALSGAIWVLYGIGDGWPKEPRIEVSTLGDPKGSQDAKDQTTEETRAALFQECVREVFAQARKPGDAEPVWLEFHSEMIRIAQLLVFADSQASARAVSPPRFAWPWNERKAPKTLAGENEICTHGMNHRYELDPPVDRPCAEGLQCCYPCGIQGCDRICLPGCPGRIP